MSESKDKIEEIEKEIREIKSAVNQVSELASTVEDLKRALIDIRSTINEIENPFNLLKLITDEEVLARVNEAKPILEKMAAEKEEKSEQTQKMAPQEKEESKRPEEPLPKPIFREDLRELLAPMAVKLDFRRTMALIEWVYTMLDIGFDEDSIRKICEYSEFFSFIPRGSASYISSLASAVKRAKTNGISEDIFTLSIYNIANIMGVKIDQSELSELIKNFLRSRRFNGVWSKGWASQ
ncbi:MAG: hypothetical protein QW502_02400 [Candidatus Bathyarchaeia archaeon]|nr:hypothetical protein [Candidatus Bathyarchaeota archaeon]